MSVSSTAKPAHIYGIEPDAEVHWRVNVRAARRAIELSAMATACWYLIWFLLPVDVTAWAGAIIFFIAAAGVFWFARTMLLRQVSDEFRRRKELLAFAEKYRAQNNPTT